jgi:transposase
MSDEFSKVEVITGVARRRRFSTEQKLAVVAETMQPGQSISYVARQRGLSPSLIFRWRRLMSDGGKEAVSADDAVVAAAEVRRLEERVRELERLLGRKTLEVEILREALERARAKIRPCCRARRWWTVCREDCGDGAWGRALEPDRATGSEEAPARATDPGGRCRAGRRDPPSGRSAPNLWLSADRRAPQARAAIRRAYPGQRQAHLPPDAQAWPAVGPPHRATATPRA